MSTKKKIEAGDTLTVSDLTNDHRGAVIEVGPEDGIISRLKLDRVRVGVGANVLWTPKETCRAFIHGTPVKVITPPPVVQPDEPTILGQCIRIEGDDDWLGVVVDPPGADCKIRDTEGYRWSWVSVLDRAGDRQIIVSDPPRWPDETPEVPERIEVGEWPDDDTHLREWEWFDLDDDPWRWYTEPGWGGADAGWSWTLNGPRYHSPRYGPWTRGERVA